MISQIVPLPVGNAVQLFLQLPAGAVHWRVLRNVTGVFTVVTDPASDVVWDANATDPLSFIDSSKTLKNGTLYYYQAFYWDGAAWSTDAAPTSVTPQTTYLDESVDALTLVQDRITSGIAAEIARNALKPVAQSIEVLTAPPVFENTRWPVVTIHLQQEAPVQRALGEEIANDALDTFTELYDDHEGWLAKTQIQIIGWALNPDERIQLRKALRRIVLANLPVFDASLLLQVELTQQDVEDFTTYSAPVYQAFCTFTCLTPLAVNAPGAAITDIESTVIPIIEVET